jgi:hypothetical protein
MDGRPRILLYGQSVILGAVRAGLELDARLDVIAVSPPATAQELARFSPDAILFDTDAGCSGPAFAMLRANPALLLIGIDPASEQLTIVSTHTERGQSIADLVRVIQGEAARADRDSE